MSNPALKIVLIVAILLISPSFIDFCMAQPGPPPGGGPAAGPPCWPPPCIPIDGGIGLLLAAGALFGIKKTIDLSKNKKVG